MNFTKLKKKNKGVTTALVQMAVMATSFSASAATYYVGRRGNYGVSGTNNYLVDPDLLGVSKDLFKYRKVNPIKEKSKKIHAEDLTIHTNAISELLIVDQNIKDYRQFSRLMKPGVALVEIPQGVDGFSFLLKSLAKYQHLKAVHLFSHANAGELLLGKTLIDSKTLNSHPEFAQVVNKSIKAGGDFLLYGCELAKGEKGDEFLQIIKGKTHVDLAASTDMTGNIAFKGNWNLEVQKGSIETKPLANSIAMKDFTELLQTTTFQGSSWTVVNGGQYNGAASTDATVSQGGFVLKLDGQQKSTKASATAFNFGMYEKRLTISLNGGQQFKPALIKMTSYSYDASYNEINVSINITTNLGGSITTSIPFFQATPTSIDLSSLPAGATSIIITPTNTTDNFKGRIDQLALNNISAPNSAPTNIAISSSSINQSAGTNAVVGTLSSTDVDAANTHTYSLVAGTGDTNNASFNISGSSLRANNASVMAPGIYSVRIRTNDNAGGTFDKQFIITVVDNISPTIAISTNKANLKAGETATLTFTLSEASSNFVIGDIVVAGGSLSGFSGSGTVYTATFTPTVNSIANGTVNVAANVFTDLAGNSNTAATQFSMGVDTQLPTVTISSSVGISGSTTTNSPIPFTIIFSKTVTNFIATDITVANGTISSFSGSGTTYTFNITPVAAGNVTVGVAANVASDAAGNGNTLATQFVVNYQNVLPVTLVDFTVKMDGNYAKLQWQTAIEQNNSGFEVYRSGNDKQFIRLTQLEGQNIASLYTFVDKKPLNGVNYYRLIQVDRNGKTTELGEKVLNFDLSKTNVTVYPNPVVNKANIVFQPGKYTVLSVSSTEGKMLQKRTLTAAQSELTIDLSYYPVGIYFVKLTGADGSVVRKVVRK